MIAIPTGKDKMDYQEAAHAYMAASQATDYRSRAIVYAVNTDMGRVVAESFTVAAMLDRDAPTTIEALVATFRDEFVKSVARNAAGAERPRGGMAGADPADRVIIDVSQVREIRDDGHTYVNGEKVD